MSKELKTYKELIENTGEMVSCKINNKPAIGELGDRWFIGRNLVTLTIDGGEYIELTDRDGTIIKKVKNIKLMPKAKTKVKQWSK